MSETSPVRAAPAPAGTIVELWGVFRTDAALQDAIGRLTRIGFDRADLSLPDLTADAAHRTPEQGAQNPHTEDDNRQMRTLHASMAGSVGAMLAAGVVIATGGLALPAVAAAAAAGVGAGALAHGAEGAMDAAQTRERQYAAAEGRLVLAARLKDATLRAQAIDALNGAGAEEVREVTRGDPAAARTAAG
jgi:hypothetical protein